MPAINAAMTIKHGWFRSKPSPHRRERHRQIDVGLLRDVTKQFQEMRALKRKLDER
jgi:hypothetical protein